MIKGLKWGIYDVMKSWRKILPLLIVAGAVIYLSERGRGSVETEHMIQATEATFAAEVDAADRWVLVDFWAAWCGPCRALMPVLDALAEDYAGRVKFVKVEVDENPGLAERFHVQSIPLVALFRDGTPVADFAGYRSRSQVVEWLESHMNERL